MKKIIPLIFALICLVTLIACDTNGDESSQNNAQPAYFVGEVIEIYDAGCLVEVTDEGNYGGLKVGATVQITTDVENCPEYGIGNHLRVTFDGNVAESYPPQILHVISIEKTDHTGNSIE